MKVKTRANIALTLACLSWLPLFNFVIAPLTIYHSIRALLKGTENDQKTMVKAIIALVIGLLVTVLSILYLVNYFTQGAMVSFCTQYLNGVNN